MTRHRELQSKEEKTFKPQIHFCSIVISNIGKSTPKGSDTCCETEPYFLRHGERQSWKVFRIETLNKFKLKKRQKQTKKKKMNTRAPLKRIHSPT